MGPSTATTKRLFAASWRLSALAMAASCAEPAVTPAPVTPVIIAPAPVPPEPVAPPASAAPAPKSAPADPYCAPATLPLANTPPAPPAPAAGNVRLAGYLSQMHNQIHPRFADTELDAFDKQPASAPVNDHSLCAAVVILVSPTGGAARIDLVHPSGVDAFDEAVLRSVRTAAPFPAPPRELTGAGNTGTRIAWEFRRDPVFSCTTMFTRPVDP
jgi:TonB family protein